MYVTVCARFVLQLAASSITVLAGHQSRLIGSVLEYICHEDVLLFELCFVLQIIVRTC